MEARTVIVVAGGGVPALLLPGRLPDGVAVIAADGGIDRAHALGLHVDLAIGDFDSVSPAGLAAAEAAGARVARYPADKDATDLELALDTAMELRPTRIVVVGSDAGRLDHLLASVLLLGLERYAGTVIDACLGPVRIHIVRDSRTLSGTPGELVSLLPMHGAADGVTTQGLVYPLAGETLAAGSSRGVSNVFETRSASVSLEHGVLAVVRPGRAEP